MFHIKNRLLGKIPVPVLQRLTSVPGSEPWLPFPFLQTLGGWSGEAPDTDGADLDQLSDCSLQPVLHYRLLGVWTTDETCLWLSFSDIHIHTYLYVTICTYNFKFLTTWLCFWNGNAHCLGVGLDAVLYYWGRKYGLLQQFRNVKWRYSFITFPMCPLIHSLCCHLVSPRKRTRNVRKQQEM